MSKQRNPLDETFQIDRDLETASIMDEDDYENIEIPEVVELDFVIERCMMEYKECKAMMMFAEPKHKIALMELCRDFLAQAKDATYKRDTLKQKMGKKTPNSETAEQEQQEPNRTFTREELEKQIRVVNGSKTG